MAKRITNKVMVKNTKLTKELAVLYTVPAEIQSAILSSIRICNFSDSIASFDIHIVPEGETASEQNLIVKSLDLNGASVWTDMSAITLEKGMTIYAKADVHDTLSIYISGIEIENN